MRSLVVALLVLGLAVGCASDDAPLATDERPVVLILRAVPDPHHDAFMDELRTQRFVVGRDVTLHPLDGQEMVADAAEAAATIAALDVPPDLVVAYSTTLAQTAVAELPDTPVVAIVNDPVASGLLERRDRPEGRVTGVTYASPPDRTLDLATRLLGRLDRIGYLAPAGDPAVAGHRAGILDAAAAAGIEVVDASFTAPDTIAAAVDRLADADVDVTMVATATSVFAVTDELGAAMTEAGLIAVSNNARTEFAGLVLEPDGDSVRRQVARQAARVLAGDPIEQIPVEDPRRFRLVLDDGVLAALGIDAIAPDLVRQADQVR